MTEMKFMTDREKAFINLNKRLLKLTYQKAQFKTSGENPPDNLLNEIENLERQIRIISRALK